MNIRKPFIYRQAAWTATEIENWSEASRIIIESKEYSKGNPWHLAQIAYILSLNTVENFFRAEHYYEEALNLKKNDTEVKKLFNNYKKTKSILEGFKNLTEQSILPDIVIKTLQPSLKYLRLRFPTNSDDYQEELVKRLHLMEGDVYGTHDELAIVMDNYHIGPQHKFIRSKYFSNMGRINYLHWSANHGLIDSFEIRENLKKSLDIDPTDPFTHCWLGTYYKEVEKNFGLAKYEYGLALQYSESAVDEFDHNHPIFSNNMALLIIDEVLRRERDILDLYEAEKLLLYARDINTHFKQNFAWAEINLERCRNWIDKLIKNNNS